MKELDGVRHMLYDDEDLFGRKLLFAVSLP
jgi:hypothetical protein